MFDLHLQRSGDAEVGTAQALGLRDGEVRGAFILVARGEQAAQEAGEGIVGLVGVLVAVGDRVLTSWRWQEGCRNWLCQLPTVRVSKVAEP